MLPVKLTQESTFYVKEKPEFVGTLSYLNTIIGSLRGEPETEINDYAIAVIGNGYECCYNLTKNNKTVKFYSQLPDSKPVFTEKVITDVNCLYNYSRSFYRIVSLSLSIGSEYQISELIPAKGSKFRTIEKVYAVYDNDETELLDEGTEFEVL